MKGSMVLQIRTYQGDSLVDVREYARPQSLAVGSHPHSDLRLPLHQEDSERTLFPLTLAYEGGWGIFLSPGLEASTVGGEAPGAIDPSKWGARQLQGLMGRVYPLSDDELVVLRQGLLRIELGLAVPGPKAVTKSPGGRDYLLFRLLLFSAIGHMAVILMFQMVPPLPKRSGHRVLPPLVLAPLRAPRRTVAQPARALPQPAASKKASTSPRPSPKQKAARPDLRSLLKATFSGQKFWGLRAKGAPQTPARGARTKASALSAAKAQHKATISLQFQKQQAYYFPSGYMQRQMAPMLSRPSWAGWPGKKRRQKARKRRSAKPRARLKASIRRILRRRRHEIAACRRFRDPKRLFGHTELKWVVDGRGFVKRALIVHSPYASKDVRSCILRRMQRWRFPASQGQVQIGAQFTLR